jgi:thioredoxin 1
MKKLIGAILVLGLTLFGGCKFLQKWFSPKEETKTIMVNTANIINIENKEDFKTKVLESEIPVIVKFETEWCGACKEMTPAYAKASEEFKDKIKFVTVDAEKLADTAKELKISGVPAFIFIKEGKAESKIEGGMEEADFIDWIEEVSEEEAE